MGKSKLQLIVLTALISALCVIGGFIKVPGFITTSALDTAPAFISVAFLPPLFSGFAALIGHFATSLTSGFPLGPFHILIAVEMFIIVYVFNILHQKGYKIMKWIFLIVANGVLSPLPFYFIMSPAFYSAAVVSLTIATVINALVAFILIPVILNVVNKGKVRNT